MGLIDSLTCLIFKKSAAEDEGNFMNSFQQTKKNKNNLVGRCAQEEPGYKFGGIETKPGILYNSTYDSLMTSFLVILRILIIKAFL